MSIISAKQHRDLPKLPQTRDINPRLPPYPLNCPADWCISTRSSCCSPASLLPAAVHPVWNRLFGSWRWCLARTRFHSTCPFVRHTGERSPVWWAHCRLKNTQQWRKGRRNVGRRLCCLKKALAPVNETSGIHIPLYSRKLHMRVRRDRTSWETSLMILAFSLGESVVNHFARRCSRSQNTGRAWWATSHIQLCLAARARWGS